MTDSPGVLEWLSGKSAALFLIAGAVLVVFAVNTGARVLADSGISAVHSFVGPAGFFLGLVGLVGLYPSISASIPLLARVAGAVAVIPTVGWFLITVVGIGSSAGVLPGVSVIFPAVFSILVFLTTMLGYILFSVGSIRAEGHSGAVSLVLLAPVVPFVALIVGAAILGPIEWAEFVIDGAHALAYLSVGIVLRSKGGRTDRPEVSADPTP